VARIIGLGKLGMTCPLLFALATVAAVRSTCADDPHQRNPLYPYSNHCTDCHAPDLKGGLGPSCFSCHDGGWWDERDAKNAAPPLDHTVLKGQQKAQHKPGFGDPRANDCRQCHGSKLYNGFAPSCYTCHGRIWAGEGPPSDHTAVKGGDAEHKPGFGDPLANGCTQCHGPNLNDGFAPSCYKCHGERWAGGGPPADHTVLKGENDAQHKPGFGDPFANDCTDCHGPNLTDGFAPSCYSCHDRIWAGEGPPADHTELKLDFAAHKPGFWDPVGNDCTQCHGPNLDDGFATACSDCHGPVWDGTDGHHMPGRDDPWIWCTTCHGDELLGGRVETGCVDCHNPFEEPDTPESGHNIHPLHVSHDIDDRLNPYDNCAVCHGDPDLNEGGIGPGCKTCHEQTWPDRANRPPVVDPGGDPPGSGDYTGVVGVAVEFDANGTSDPDDDLLSYEWDFGDGSTPTSSNDPIATHTFTQAGTYDGHLTVRDNVNDPVTVDIVVEVSEDPPPSDDHWTVTTTNEPAETFGITFEDNSGSLMGQRDDGGLAIGIEFPHVIFWIDVTGSQIWDGGDIYFGNIDRGAETMSGIVFDDTGGIFTFTGSKP
jgi:hypothetical protein